MNNHGDHLASTFARQVSNTFYRVGVSAPVKTRGEEEETLLIPEAFEDATHQRRPTRRSLRVGSRGQRVPPVHLRPFGRRRKSYEEGGGGSHPAEETLAASRAFSAPSRAREESYGPRFDSD